MLHSLDAFFMFLRMMTKTFLFLPAYAHLMIGFFVYPHHPSSSSCCTCKPSFCITYFVSSYPILPFTPSVHEIYCITHFVCFYLHPSPSSSRTCKTIRSRNIYCISHFVCFSHFAKSLTITHQKKPSAHPSYNKCNQILFYIVKVS